MHRVDHPCCHARLIHMQQRLLAEIFALPIAVGGAVPGHEDKQAGVSEAGEAKRVLALQDDKFARPGHEDGP